MSKIQSSAEHLTLNADGSGNDIKFQSNGSEVASISDGGVVTATSFAGSGANLTGVGVAGISSSADATAISIDSSERVGIGAATSPNTLMHIKAASGSVLRVEETGGSYIDVEAGGSTGHIKSKSGTDITFSPGGTNRLQLFSSGRARSPFTAASWCNVNMSAGAFNDHHNHDSLTDVGTGAFVLSFTVNMNDSSYSVVGCNQDGYLCGYTNFAQDSFRGYSGDSNWTKVDLASVCFAVFGN